MIELPEALTIARQISEDLRGKRIRSGSCGNSPHKFAFYSYSPEEYESILPGKTVGGARGHGSCIIANLEPDYALVLGLGGEKIQLHASEATLPAKRQLLLEFEDGTFLTVSVSGWGAALLLRKSELDGHGLVGPARVSPIDDEFTFDYFNSLFSELKPDDPASVKFLIISKPGVWGVGNGYLQDILFRAKIHPRRRAISLTDAEKQALHGAIVYTLREAAELGGRDSERDLHGEPGGYERILHSKAAGRPCPNCGTPIEKIAFLGGACYFCPSCQV